MQKQKEREKEAEAKKIKIKAKKNKTPKVDVENVEAKSKKARNITDPEKVAAASKQEGMLSPQKGQDNKNEWSGSSGRETATGSGQSVPEPKGMRRNNAESEIFEG